ncbi:hypothetical protein QR680_014365 [Steinernema hermaphroditum]|uniref:Uncharacterized protein n=1 Tax=Steinernema hermaphroditum TaxID=289476 RepID=A0AA39IA07_9BILA|nr:hypothetical protein QR680_014365 [Steinernema hermaphroditum]
MDFCKDSTALSFADVVKGEAKTDHDAVNAGMKLNSTWPEHCDGVQFVCEQAGKLLRQCLEAETELDWLEEKPELARGDDPLQEMPAEVVATDPYNTEVIEPDSPEPAARLIRRTPVTPLEAEMNRYFDVVYNRVHSLTDLLLVPFLSHFISKEKARFGCLISAFVYIVSCIIYWPFKIELLILGNPGGDAPVTKQVYGWLGFQFDNPEKSYRHKDQDAAQSNFESKKNELIDFVHDCLSMFANWSLLSFFVGLISKPTQPSNQQKRGAAPFAYLTSSLNLWPFMLTLIGWLQNSPISHYVYGSVVSLIGDKGSMIRQTIEKLAEEHVSPLWTERSKEQATENAPTLLQQPDEASTIRTSSM